MKNVVIVRDPNYLKNFYGKTSSSSDGRFFQAQMPNQVALRSVRAALLCFIEGVEVQVYMKHTPAVSQKDRYPNVTVKAYTGNVEQRDLLVFVSDNPKLADDYPESIVVDTANSNVIAIGSAIHEKLLSYTDAPLWKLNHVLSQYRLSPHINQLRDRLGAYRLF